MPLLRFHSPDFLEKGQQLRCAGGTSFQASEDVRDDAEFKKSITLIYIYKGLSKFTVFEVMTSL